MAKRMAAKRVENLRIVHEHDEDARPEEKTGDDPEYAEQDQEYIDSWKRDEWSYIGVLVECDLIVAETVQHISSTGLWGIEDNSGDKYLHEVEREEYAALVDILEALGVPHKSVPALSTAKRRS